MNKPEQNENTGRHKSPLQNLYSVHDYTSGAFWPPFTAENHAVARRSFAQTVNNPKTIINQYPRDFVLYHIGDFDPDDGSIGALTSPEMVCLAESLIQSQSIKPTNDYEKI